MKKYILVFLAAYVLLTVAVMLLTMAVQLRDGGSLNLAATLGAALVAAHWFARGEKRAPTVPERRAFAWQALLSVWATTLVLGALGVAFFLPPGEAARWMRVFGASAALLGMAVA